MVHWTRENVLMMTVAVAATGLAIVLVYVPQRDRMEDLRTQIASQKAALLADVQKTSVLPDLIRQVRQMQDRYKDIDRKVPGRTELGGFLREISSQLNEERLTNQLIEPGNPTQQELVHTLPIVMKFRGSYLSLASFLGRLEKMERLARVQRLRIQNDSKAAELDIEMRMNIFFTDKEG